jgi:hypothetical protein
LIYNSRLIVQKLTHTFYFLLSFINIYFLLKASTAISKKTSNATGASGAKRGAKTNKRKEHEEEDNKNKSNENHGEDPHRIEVESKDKPEIEQIDEKEDDITNKTRRRGNRKDEKKETHSNKKKNGKSKKRVVVNVGKESEEQAHIEEQNHRATRGSKRKEREQSKAQASHDERNEEEQSVVEIKKGPSQKNSQGRNVSKKRKNRPASSREVKLVNEPEIHDVETEESEDRKISKALANGGHEEKRKRTRTRNGR